MNQYSLPRRALIAGMGAAALFASGVQAQGAFPNRPITLVSPYQAGGSADAIARAIAEAAAKDLGQPVVVESKPGAEGLVGAADVQKAAPDGYRVLWGGAGSLMIVPALRKAPPFDPVTAFTPIAASVDFSFFLYVNPSFPAKDMKEFIAYVKAHPGKVAYATGNNQGLLTMADLSLKHNLDMVKVQYKGETGASADLLTNRVQAMWATTSVLPFAKDGRLRVLATTLPKRSPLLPDVPTMKELGISGGEFGGGWLGIYGPAGMPKPIVDRLNKAFVGAFNSQDVQTKLYNAGLVYTPVTTPDALGKYTRDQRDMYIKTVKDLGIEQE
ncbi:tripartite tricarboxylate transporter substrate binding protein [soil metagenome]